MEKTSYLKSIMEYTLAFVLSIVIYLLVSGTYHHHTLTVLYDYNGDGLFAASWVKSIIEHGWYLSNENLGAPNGYNMIDFPMADNFHFLILKGLTLFSSNYAVVVNLFFLLTFPSITLMTLFVLKRFNIIYPFALVASLLFAFVPYHFEHGQWHIFLSSYYVIPLVIWIALSVTERGALNFISNSAYIRWGVLTLLCLLIGSSGIYYAFFGVFYLLMAGLIVSVVRREWLPIIRTMILTGLIVGAGILNVSTYLLYGHATESVQRHPVESEVYSMKITPLLLPAEFHRVEPLANFKHFYTSTTKGNAGMTCSLGFIGSLGFLFLLAAIIFRNDEIKNVKPGMSDFNLIAKLNLCGVLFATMGGFGALFAYTISPMIRCYDRMSIFLAFFAFYAFFFLLQRKWVAHYGTTKNKLLWLLSLLLLVLGMLDITVKDHLTNYIKVSSTRVIKAKVDNDRHFVREVEKVIPAGGMVFQLPYVIFPEANYEHFRPYLHSKHTKWSFGTMAGSKVDAWQKQVALLPPAEMVAELKRAGFIGIYINRDLYTDKGVEVELEKQLTYLTKSQPIVSENASLSFFLIPN